MAGETLSAQIRGFNPQGLGAPLIVIMMLAMVVIPLPPMALDMLFTFNIAFGLVVLLVSIYALRPLDFTVFPTILLVATLLRLALNIASTRVVLLEGHTGTAAAGKVIEAFGDFVIGGNYAVGLVVFAILVIINFVVVTKGAGRVSEVSARFTLDAMPGKQMAIDADLNAGLIDEGEARRRRTEIARESDFFGAMDGASKFVRGDAIAGIIITFINILGGLYVGMVEHGLGLTQSLEIYTKLTIGDGLASQIPAFIVSVAAGMLVTRSTGQTNLGEEVLGQLLSKPVALLVAAGFLLVLTLTPLPKVPLLTMAAGSGLVAFMLRRTQTTAAAARLTDERARERAKPAKIESHLTVDPLELQVGYALVRLIDRTRGGDVLDRVANIRKQIASDLGLVVPPVRIRDNGELAPSEYVVLLRGQPIARGQLYPDQVLAIDSGLASQALAGHEVREPAFGLRAWWIAPEQRETAERLSYTVVEPSGVLATHLTEIVRRHAAELLTRADVQNLLDHLKQRNPGLVDEVVPGLLKAGEVQKVLQALLRERVPIRDLETILETLGDWAPRTKDLEILTEYARNALARTICGQYKDAHGTLHVLTLDPATEDYIQANIQRLEHGSTLTLPPDRQAELAARVRQQAESAAAAAGGAPLALLCSPQVRLWVRRMLEPLLPQMPVLALNEIARGIEVQAHGVVSIEVQRADVPSPVLA